MSSPCIVLCSTAGLQDAMLSPGPALTITLHVVHFLALQALLPQTVMHCCYNNDCTHYEPHPY